MSPSTGLAPPAVQRSEALIVRARLAKVLRCAAKAPAVSHVPAAVPFTLPVAQEEVVAALDAATGKTFWEHKYPSPTDGINYTEGAGPHATPLIAGNRLFVVGSRREFFALDKHSGKVLWSHDFMKEYGAPEIDRLANSPLLSQRHHRRDRRRVRQLARSTRYRARLWKAGDVEYSRRRPSGWSRWPAAVVVFAAMHRGMGRGERPHAVFASA